MTLQHSGLQEKGRRFHAPESKPPSSHKRHPKFSLKYLPKQRKFCLDSCDKKQKAQFADQLYRLSHLTWQAINNAPRHGLGFEKISRSSMKIPIPDHITPETNIIAFRCFGKAPMIGYKIEATFYIVWLDPSFEAYSH